MYVVTKLYTPMEKEVVFGSLNYSFQQFQYASILFKQYLILKFIICIFPTNSYNILLCNLNLLSATQNFEFLFLMVT